MGLSSTEVDRIKYELGYPVTRIGAEPYITFVAVFDRAIIPYLTDVGSSSMTPVTATPGGGNVSVAVLANPTLPQVPNGPAFAVGNMVTVDVGPAQEQSVILAVTGLSLLLNLSNAHGGNGATYPVVLSGSEQIVREILQRIAAIQTQLTKIAPTTAGIESVGKDSVKMYSSSRADSRRGTRDKFEALLMQRAQARADLAEAVGVPDLRTIRSASRGGRVEMY